MGKPRAARKQPVVVSSSSDEQDSPPKRRTRGDSKTATSVSKPNLTSRRASSPKPKASQSVRKSPGKSPVKPKAIYKPITSFFSSAPPPKSTQPTPSPEKSVASVPIDDFDFDDILDSEDDDPVQQPKSTALAVRKRVRDTHVAEDQTQSRGSKKFLRTGTGARGTPPISQVTRSADVDTRPWNERFGPVSLDELAVHKKKVDAVRTWISDVLDGKARKRLLLIKGPAGSGKTTTISLLSKELGFEIHEWKNPTNSNSSSEGFVSVTAQFEDFVRRTGSFGSLVFDAPTNPRPVEPASMRQKQLIMVEEFPNTFTRESSTVQSFRSSILNFLAASTPSATTFFSERVEITPSVTPVVMIISETLLSTNTAAADSFTAHRLLGPEILSHSGVTTIEFNPIAPTFMIKALDQIVLKEARKSGRRKVPGPQVIQRLSELGDIRSATSSLEFLCVRGDEDEGWSAKVNFTKKKGPKDTPLTKMERESLELVTQRESTLGIFHAVGKVVYNKRLTENSASPPLPQPPNWFPERRRPKVSEVEVDSLIDELGTDTHTFIAALHENYVLSCTGADSEETMDSIEGCIDALSDADLLSPDRFGAAGFHRRTFQGTSSDNLRQEEMSFQVSVRGLLYALPAPVKRTAPPPGLTGAKGKGISKTNPFVMYYPVSLRIWRTQEEIGGLLGLWISRAQRGELLTPVLDSRRPQTASTGGVDTWKKSSPSARAEAQDDEPTFPILLGSGGSARYEMLLERLPYLPIILRKSRMTYAANTPAIREIRKIISFDGAGLVASTENQEDEDDVDEGREQEQWSTDHPASPQKNRKNVIRSKVDDSASAAAGAVENDVARLVLSDDDIED